MFHDLKQKFVTVTDSSTDIFDTIQYTTAVDMKDADGVIFLISKEANTDTVKLIAQRCDSDGSNAAAIAGYYREGVGVLGDLTALETTGATTTATSTLIAVYVSARSLGASRYCRLSMDEITNDPTNGSVVAILIPKASY